MKKIVFYALTSEKQNKRPTRRIPIGSAGGPDAGPARDGQVVALAPAVPATAGATTF